MTHIHYRSHNYVVEYTPLMMAYIVLCLYLYFSVREFTRIYRHFIVVTVMRTCGAEIKLTVF